MVVGMPMEIGEFMLEKAVARCNNKQGALRQKNLSFNIGIMSKDYEYIEWTVYASMCNKYRYREE
jgi:hypothetical protein